MSAKNGKGARETRYTGLRAEILINILFIAAAGIFLIGIIALLRSPRGLRSKAI